MQLTHKLKGNLLKINSVDVKEPHILHKLSNIGIMKGNVIEVLDYAKTTDVLHIKVFNVQYAIRERDCKLINVSYFNQD